MVILGQSVYNVIILKAMHSKYLPNRSKPGKDTKNDIRKRNKIAFSNRSVELPAPGLGILNYDLYLKRLSAIHPNIPLIIEHLDENDIPRAKKFIDDKLKKGGL